MDGASARATPPAAAPGRQSRWWPRSPRRSLWRVGTVAGLTGAVVGLWMVIDPGDPARDHADAVITAPAPEASTLGQLAPPDRPGPDATPAAGALPTPPAPPEPDRPDSFIRYLVQPGDTVYDISLVYGVPIPDILRFNPSLGDGTRIQPGQIVLVPEIDE